MLKAFFLPDKQLQKFAIGQAFKTFALVTGIHVKEKYPLFEEL
jgi:hypothetical protein